MYYICSLCCYEFSVDQDAEFGCCSGVALFRLFFLKGICWFACWWEFCAGLMGLGVCIPLLFVFLCMILLFRY